MGSAMPRKVAPTAFASCRQPRATTGIRSTIGRDGATAPEPAPFTSRTAADAVPSRIDPKYRWHFIWEGTGEHYFSNGTAGTGSWAGQMKWSSSSASSASID